MHAICVSYDHFPPSQSRADYDEYMAVIDLTFIDTLFYIHENTEAGYIDVGFSSAQDADLAVKRPLPISCGVLKISTLALTLNRSNG